MRLFIDERQLKEDKEFHFRVTPGYIEGEGPIDPEHSCFYYFIQRDQSSLWVATCWGEAFDAFLEEMDAAKMETIFETWPSLQTLLQNGINDKYREAALVRLEDADYGEPRWFIATIVGNLNFESEEGPDSVFGDRTMQGLAVVSEKSWQLGHEMSSKELSNLKYFGKQMAAGLGAVALGVLYGLLGGGSDNSA